MADARDLKSLILKGVCGFKSRRRQLFMSLLSNVLDAIRPTGVALDTAATEYAQAARILAGHSLIEAASFYMRCHANQVAARMVADAVETFGKRKAGQGAVRSSLSKGDSVSYGKLCDGFQCGGPRSCRARRRRLPRGCICIPQLQQPALDASWGLVCNGRQNVSGKAANKLQGIIDTREGNVIMALVDHLSKFPFAIDDPFDYGRAWALLCNRIRKASDEEFAKVVGGSPSGWSLLCFIARDITGPHTRYEHPRTGNKHRRPHYEALRVCANRFGRVPTKTEVRTEYLYSGGSDMTNGDFSKELAKAGVTRLSVPC